ncbi:MAG: hypothetical protein ACLP1X_20500 [Polyangiaceae bacterium]|jgi:hypothetical protein
MARRTADLSHLRRALDALGIRKGSAASRAVGRVVGDLCDAEALPVEGVDVFVVLLLEQGQAVSIAAYGRRTAGRDLWVWYFANGSVQVIAVTKGL